MLHLLGTSHIAKQSLNEVQEAFATHKPDIVAIELDPQRLQALFSNKQGKPRLRDISRIGIQGFLFQLLGGWAERKLGDVVGVKPGAEMKRAVRLASTTKARLALIDQPITLTLKRLSKAIGWKERWQFLKELISAPFKQNKLSFDLTKVPQQELITELLKKTRQDYPAVHKVLITERNRYMAAQLKKLKKTFPDKTILAIVGAGHIVGMTKLLQQDSPAGL